MAIAIFSHYLYLCQKQQSRSVLRKRCSGNMQQIYRRGIMPKCDFIKVAKQLYWNQTLACVFSSKLIWTRVLIYTDTKAGAQFGCALKLWRFFDLNISFTNLQNNWSIIWFFSSYFNSFDVFRISGCLVFRKYLIAISDCPSITKW